MSGNLNCWPARTGRLLARKAAGLYCAAAILAPLALASTPAPYGEYFVRLGASWPDAGIVAPWAELDTGAAANDASFQRQLGLLEDEGGPYADGLAEPLADLARLYLRSGDIEQAQRAYERALHVVRVNDGLQSERQVPILRELFEIYRMTGDMATLDARYDYFFRLYGSGLPPHTPLRIKAALEYLRWQREALRLGLDERDTSRMLAAYSLNERILESVASDSSIDPADYRALVLSQLRNLYLIQDGYEQVLETSGPSPYSSVPGMWDEKDAGQHRLEAIQRTALARGRLLLEELIDRTPQQQVEDLAAAWLELADWNQWNDRRSEAVAAYSEVLDLLRDTGLADLLQQWLGQPVELPANGAFWQPSSLAESTEPIVVHARYDVSSRGRAENIETTALDADHESKAGRVKRDLSRTRFRPRMVNGQPEAELQLQRDYQVLN